MTRVVISERDLMNRARADIAAAQCKNTKHLRESLRDREGIRVSLVLLFVLLLLALPCGCDLPRDPERTLENVRNHQLRVGILHREPWATYQESEAGGLEVELVRDLAEELNAEVEWVPGNESELLNLLERYELDLVIGGLAKSSPWKDRVAFSRAYVTTAVVIGVPRGMAAPDSISEMEVSVRPGDPAAGYVREAGGIPVPTLELTGAMRPAAAEASELEAMGFTLVDLELHQEEHVFAAPPGENGWLVWVEKRLLGREAEMRTRLREITRTSPHLERQGK